VDLKSCLSDWRLALFLILFRETILQLAPFSLFKDLIIDCIILPDRELGDLQRNISKILQNKTVEDYKHDPAERVTSTLTEGQTSSLASGR
jgi:hypothetical protein